MKLLKDTGVPICLPDFIEWKQDDWNAMFDVRHMDIDHVLKHTTRMTEFIDYFIWSWSSRRVER